MPKLSPAHFPGNFRRRSHTSGKRPAPVPPASEDTTHCDRVSRCWSFRAVSHSMNFAEFSCRFGRCESICRSTKGPVDIACKSQADSPSDGSILTRTCRDRNLEPRGINFPARLLFPCFTADGAELLRGPPQMSNPELQDQRYELAGSMSTSRISCPSCWVGLVDVKHLPPGGQFVAFPPHALEPGKKIASQVPERFLPPDPPRPTNKNRLSILFHLSFAVGSDIGIIDGVEVGGVFGLT